MNLASATGSRLAKLWIDVDHVSLPNAVIRPILNRCQTRQAQMQSSIGKQQRSYATLHQSRRHQISSTSSSRSSSSSTPRLARARIASLSRLSFSTSCTTAAPTPKVVDYLLADVGEGITECEIVKWFVEPGNRVEEFDILVEVQSDKASVEITSRYTGKVLEHCYKVGEVARVGSPLCRIEVVAKEAESEREEDGRSIANEQGESQSSASASDTSKEPRQEQEGSSESEPSLAKTERRQTASDRTRALATPAVRRITRENGLAITDITGTGRDGRVTKEDVQLHLNGASQPKPSTTSQVYGQHGSLHSVESSFEAREIPLTGVRKAMFRAMSAMRSVPHFGYSDEIDVTALDAMRKQIQQQRQPLQGNSAERLTLLPFLLKALSLTLIEHPLFRSSLDEDKMMLFQRDQHLLSIAFASSKGLVTPTLRGDVRTLSVMDISHQITNLQRLGATRGLSQEELGSGSTVTLSNIGSIGGTYTFPLLPRPGQLAIGAVGRTKILPRFDDAGEVIRATILPVSFSADHRVVEGVELARFVNDWKLRLENPASWLVEMR